MASSEVALASVVGGGCGGEEDEHEALLDPSRDESQPEAKSAANSRQPNSVAAAPARPTWDANAHSVRANQQSCRSPTQLTCHGPKTWSPAVLAFARRAGPRHKCRDRPAALRTSHQIRVSRSEFPELRSARLCRRPLEAVIRCVLAARRGALIERVFAWLMRSRRLVTRYEHHAQNFLGFVQLACAVILLRRL